MRGREGQAAEGGCECCGRGGAGAAGCVVRLARRCGASWLGSGLDGERIQALQDWDGMRHEGWDLQ